MFAKKHFLAALLAGAAISVPFATAWAQGAPAPAATPAPAPTPALPPGVIVIDGYKYALPAAALQNLDAVRTLISVGDALGMIRDNTYGGATHYTIGQAVDGWEYHATGTMDGQNVTVVLGLDYRAPSIRYEVTRADKSHEITVASGDLAWDESKPGVYLQPAKTSAADRLMQIYLLPAAVITMGRQAADKIKLSTTKEGLNQLTIPIPKYSTNLVATLDASGHPIHTEMAVGGKVYSSDYSGYEGDPMEFHVYFPHHIVQKVDGKVTADLNVSEHWVNPYMIWPIPAQLKVATK